MSQEKYPVVVGQSTVLALSRVDTYYTNTVTFANKYFFSLKTYKTVSGEVKLDTSLKSRCSTLYSMYL